MCVCVCRCVCVFSNAFKEALRGCSKRHLLMHLKRLSRHLVMLLKRHFDIYYIAGRVRENTRPADPHVLLLKRHLVIYYIAGQVRENTRPAGSSFKEALSNLLHSGSSS